MQENLTDTAIDDELLKRGVPPTDIVLGMQPPAYRVVSWPSKWNIKAYIESWVLLANNMKAEIVFILINSVGVNQIRLNA